MSILGRENGTPESVRSRRGKNNDGSDLVWFRNAGKRTRSSWAVVGIAACRRYCLFLNAYFVRTWVVKNPPSTLKVVQSVRILDPGVLPTFRGPGLGRPGLCRLSALLIALFFTYFPYFYSSTLTDERGRLSTIQEAWCRE